jgi:hypothetical protein
MAHFQGATKQAQLWADEVTPHPPFINCVPASGVNLINAATNGAHPTTDAEVQALRVATGDVSGGEGLEDLNKGLVKRYGYGGHIDNTWATIKSGLATGTCFAVIGRYDSLPPDFRKPQPSFKDGHCAYIGPRDPNTVYWVDPLDRSDNGHPAVRIMSLAVLQKFVASMGYQSLGIKEFSHVPVPPKPPKPTTKVITTLCNDINLRTAPNTQASSPGQVNRGVKLTVAVNPVSGGAWSIACPKALKGHSWWKVVVIGGKKTKTVYIASGLAR